MSLTDAVLNREARLLSADERTEPPDAVRESLDYETIVGLQATWTAEIEHRIGVYERGEAKLVFAEGVSAQARTIARS